MDAEQKEDDATNTNIKIENKNNNTDNNKHNPIWIAPNIIGPRYLIYATSQWCLLVDENLNMYYNQKVIHFINLFWC